MSLSPRPTTVRAWPVVTITATTALAAFTASDGTTWPAAALVGCLLGWSVFDRRQRRAARALAPEKAAPADPPTATEPRGLDAESVVAATSAGVMLVDQHGIITQGNAAAGRILGHDEIVGVPISQILPTLKAHQPAAAAVSEHIAMTQDGNPREIAVQADPLRLPAAGEQVLLVLMDVTTVHDAERQLLVQNNLLQSASMALFDAKVSAEEADRRKTQFLTYASHEIRTPLTAILGFAEQLQDKSLAGEEHDEAVRTIRRNGEHLLTVLSDVLDLAKIEADHLEVRNGPCDLRATVKEVVKLFARSAHERGGEITIAEDSPLPVTVNTDVTRLRQILINLLSNALRQPSTTPIGEGPRLLLALTARADPPEVRIELTDPATSLTAAELERMFEPFEKAARCADRGPNSALGLAISRRLARLLGGDITARSAAASGTTIVFTFHPGELQPEALWTRSAASHAPSLEAEAPLSARVLLAEDGADNQRLISTILRRAGIEVTVVGDGARAVEAVDAAACGPQRFDAIVMDMQMPVMDGYEAAARLRAKGHQQPILALTANGFADARRRCLEAGCDDYASKPIDRRTLVATLRGLLLRGPRQRETLASAS